jgi:hypothetical protein
VQHPGADDDVRRVELEVREVLEVADRVVDAVAEALEPLARELLHGQGRVDPRASRRREPLEEELQIGAVPGAEVDDVRDLDARVGRDADRQPARELEDVCDDVVADPSSAPHARISRRTHHGGARWQSRSSWTFAERPSISTTRCSREWD